MRGRIKTTALRFFFLIVIYTVIYFILNRTIRSASPSTDDNNYILPITRGPSGNPIVNDTLAIVQMKALMANADQEVKDQTTVRPASCDGCMKRHFKFLINSSHVCSGSSQSRPLELLILIASVNSQKGYRDAIRKSWGKVTKQNTHPKVRHAFLLGFTTEADLEILKEENKENGDLVVQDFKDTYRNLTFKSLMAFEWSKRFCPHFSYMMKTDDDVYVNMKNIHTLILNDRLENSITGYCPVNITPVREPNEKNYISRQEFPDDFFPGYCTGTGYVMPRNVAFNILAISPNVPFIYLEDVYVAFCALKLNYRLQYKRGFNSYKLPVSTESCGDYGRENMYTSHMLSESEIVNIWDRCGQYID